MRFKTQLFQNTFIVARRQGNDYEWNHWRKQQIFGDLQSAISKKMPFPCFGFCMWFEGFWDEDTNISEQTRRRVNLYWETEEIYGGGLILRNRSMWEKYRLHILEPFTVEKYRWQILESKDYLLLYHNLSLFSLTNLFEKVVLPADLPEPTFSAVVVF